MANEPSWDDIFSPAGTAVPAQQTVSPPNPGAVNGSAPSAGAPTSRRELREAEGRGRSSVGAPPPKKRRRLGWLWALLIILGLVAGGAAAAWIFFEDQVRQVLGWELPTDYVGTGNGEEVVVVIQSGDIGEDVARTLAKSGVTMTFDAFYRLLLANPDVSFEPGNYTLQKEMSAASALTALQDPGNKIVNKVTIPEGTAAVDAYALLAAGTGLSVDDFTAAASDPSVYGLPPEATSVEGFLFPATYTFDPGVTADQVIQRLVDETISRLDAAGVAPEDRFRVITLASIVQRESGPNVDDMYKIGRVFTNRIDQGMRLQSDATVAYGTGNTHTVWTTDPERADASNKYNTYANDGLPIGPIGNPGADAIGAAVNPTPGPWLFFVPINLKTGETVFSETAAEHEKAAAQLRQWCRASDENAAYCQ